MKSMASLDIYFMNQELLSLISAKLDKVYQPEESTIILQLHKDGKKLIKIILPSFIFIATEKSAGQELNFSKFLRKQLTNYRLANITQKNFERILELEFALNDDKKILIIELFSKGNITLCDFSYKIISTLRIQSWKDRTIKPNELYKYPPANTNPFSLSLIEFSKRLKSSEKESIVKTLAIDFSFGGIYAEEICLKSNIDKSKKSPTDQEIKSIYNAIIQISKMSIKANISNNEFFPFELESSNNGRQHFSTFSEAIEECIENPVQQPSNANMKLKSLLDVQKKQLDQIKTSIDEETSKANMIYNNYQIINSLLQLKDLDKIRQNVMVKEINKKDKTFTISIGGKNITLNINYSIDKNASAYYEKAKRMKGKVPGAENAISRTLEKINHSEIPVSKKEKTIERKKEWYEKFRWFISSEGSLVIGGRDATTNDIIVKKHMEKSDLVFHTELKGSPFVVVKASSKKIGDATIEEAAIFCASNSKQWDAKLATSDVYCISPEQVKKELGLPKGTFMIYGKRNYLKPVLKLAIGITKDNKVMCAPINAVRVNCKSLLAINQGDVKKSDIAKKIKKIFEEELRIKISLDEIMQALPPGDCSISR
ncbi:NFACT family protein [Candidatus Woesearchaeota archaeon]|nr:NFACT family protein [Candidatus Woesearchaeota archaeon]